ncbi:MAG: hypothetical protein KC996_02275 [Phycisphaerales bacterium]|nr:hypothetical protein [Phycisphaerales bacterium]
MKLKGISSLEQHIEKIVLGVILLVLLGVVSMQFMLQPNTVEVSSTRSVPPESVYTELEGQALRIESQLQDPQPQLPAVAPMDLVARYNEAFADSSDLATQLSSSLGRGVNIEQVFGGPIDTGPQNNNVTALMVPKTTQPVAVSSWATLDPFVLQEVPAYAEFVPSAQPFDFASVSIEASFNGVDLREALTGEGGGGIPRKFWAATGVTIVGFEVERQELMADGRWGSAEPITTPPMTPLPTRSIASDDGLPELTELVSKAAGAFGDIAQPMFPPTIAGEEWVPPSERVAEDANDLSEADKIRRKLARAESELERLQGRSQGGTGSRDPRPGTGKTSVRDPGGSSGGSSTSSTDKARARMEQLREDIKEYQDQLRALGESVTQTDPSLRIGGKGGVGVLDSQDIQLWAHDLGVEPGKVYRYRSRVVVNNPLFRKGPALDPNDAEQQALTKDPFARGGWSDWSGEVLVGAEQYFFVGSAEPSGAHAESPKATIEVFRMYYGFYRRSTISAAPGDRLESSARVSGRIVTIDPSAITVKEAGDQLAAIQEDDKLPLPAGFREVSGRMLIDLGVYLLEIAVDPIAGAGQSDGAAMQVILRDAEGGLIVRHSGTESTDSDAYALVSSSASQGSRIPMRLTGESAISPSYALFPDASAP